MSSALFNLTKSDFVKSAVTAVFAAVLVALGNVFTQAGFDVFHADWGEIFKLTVNVALAAFVGDVGRRFASDSDGALHTPLGKIG